MAGSLLSTAASLRAALAGFEPGLLSGEDCALVAEELAATEKACAAVRLLAAARAVQCGAHRQRGFSAGAAWLARQSGSSGAAARRALATAGRLEDCPDTKAALLAGAISLAQAAEVVETEREAPGAEAALLAVAAGSDLSRVRDQAREFRQAHTEVHDLHAQQRQARFFRHWRDRLGLVCFSGALPPETGLPWVRRIEAAAGRARRHPGQTNGAAPESAAGGAAGPAAGGSPGPAAGAAGLAAGGAPESAAGAAPESAAGRAAGGADGDGPEPWERLAADALVALTGGGPEEPRRSERAELVIVCDLFAWRRGHTHPGEVCHLVEGGPIPVEVAHQLAGDAFVAAVLHDGVNIHTVKRFGRYLPAELRTALDLGPVPHFSGRQCADCGRRWGLQYDHVDPVANHGPTSYANLQARCWPCHHDKTEQDRKAGLLGPNAPHPPAARVRPARRKRMVT